MSAAPTRLPTALVAAICLGLVGLTGCLWVEDGCEPETISIAPGDTHERVNPEALSAPYQGSWQGSMQWVQPDRPTILCITITRRDEPTLALFCDVRSSVEVPVTMRVSTADRVLDLTYEGELTIDESRKLDNAPFRLDVPLDLLSATDILPAEPQPGIGTNARASLELYHRWEGKAWGFVAARLELRDGSTRLTLGEAEF